MRTYRILLLLPMLIFAGGCAALSPSFESPKVNLTSFRVLPGQSMVPTFEIGLHVINPNRTVLKLKGLSYQVGLEGHQILTGVTNRLPVIEAYGEGDVVLQAQPDLLSTIRLFNDLVNQPRDIFNFNLEAQLDIGGLLPKIKVRETGEVRLSSQSR